ncbi:MAG: sigma-70 family RNA polymerase sigma factor [Planctomycetes bacterium]|nr:sigma-70 family RNA polymerase sigma factor [Planctomycetota bacterium]
MREPEANQTPSPHAGEVSAILTRAQADPTAAGDLLPLVYDELRALARSRLAKLGGRNNTLEPTALVHEAYVRLVGANDPSWHGRGHFFAAAAMAMRNILVDRARRKASVKHGGEAQRVDADPADIALAEPREDILALDAALTKLQQVDERKSRVVMLRYFSGLTAEETAAAMDISVPTVNREWKLAKVLLKLELGDGR